MQFEFGETDQANAFFDRNPKYLPAFERLMALSNKCFGRASGAKNHAQDVCFSLGHTCRDDYTEILFLAANGYGIRGGIGLTMRLECLSTFDAYQKCGYSPSNRALRETRLASSRK